MDSTEHRRWRGQSGGRGAQLPTRHTRLGARLLPRPPSPAADRPLGISADRTCMTALQCTALSFAYDCCCCCVVLSHGVCGGTYRISISEACYDRVWTGANVFTGSAAFGNPLTRAFFKHQQTQAAALAVPARRFVQIVWYNRPDMVLDAAPPNQPLTHQTPHANGFYRVVPQLYDPAPGTRPIRN